MEINGSLDTARRSAAYRKLIKVPKTHAGPLGVVFHAAEKPSGLSVEVVSRRGRHRHPRHKKETGGTETNKGVRVPGTGNVPPSLSITLDYIRNPTGFRLLLLVGHVPPESHYD